MLTESSLEHISPQKIEWSNKFSLGSRVIDEDHHYLITIYNSMVECITQSKGNAEFAEILSKMTDYSISHFKKEESYMAQMGYPHLEEHRRLHKEYILKTALFNSRFLSSDPPSQNEVTHFLKKWWENHIIKIDSQYEEFRVCGVRKQIVEALSMHSKESDIEGARRFFKEHIELYGVRSPMVHKISAQIYSALPYKDKESVFTICEKMLASGMMEECIIACKWSYKVFEQYSKEDFYIFESWVKEYITNWAVCDTFCNHTMGKFLELFPEYIPSIKEWCNSSNRWVRRAAAVSFIIPAKEGKFIEEVFDIADRLLTDQDDMVQKGYGWLLKVASQSHLQEVYNFVINNKKRMPRTALRYAIEKMLYPMKEEAMKR